MTHDAVLRLIRSDEIRRLVARNPAATELASRYVAGESADDALAVARMQNTRGLLTSLAPVGFAISEKGQVSVNVNTYLRLVSILTGEMSADNEISILPQLIGMGDRPSAVLPQMRDILSAAAESGVDVTLEMAPHDAVDATLELFDELRTEFPRLGITLQAMLRRTPGDLAAVIGPEVRVRLCAGENQIPAGAWVHKGQHEIALAFVRCLRQLMESDAYPMIATHDLRIIPIADELAFRTGRTAQDYEFQLFYGVRTIEQRRLADTGHRCRVYLPFGREWYDYLVLRLSRRPMDWLFRLGRK